MDRDLPFTEFGLTPAQKTSSAQRVLAGEKRATTSLLAAYAHDHEDLPFVGRRSVVRDGFGRNVAVIETRRVEIRRFCEVDANFAAIEGEGDKSLEYWQTVHRTYLRAECARVGAGWDESSEVVLDYFEIIQSLAPPAR